MKRLLTCIFLPFALHAFAQSGSLVKGKLTGDSAALAAASISLLDARDSSIVQTTRTDEKGEYRIPAIQPGRYLLRFTSIGYQPMDAAPFDILAGEPEKDLGMTALQKTQRNMQEVVVRAAKPLYQQRPDGIVVNVESNVMTKGSSALEVLERSPGVLIDRRNNNITLNGRDGVLVMLNGKLMRIPVDQLLTLLQGLSGNDIEKIELLSTPPASYDAEGSAGIINIVLKKGKRPGTSGSASLTAGYGWGEKTLASVNAAHNTGRINAYGTYSFSHDRSHSDLDGSGSQDFPPLGGKMNNYFWNISKPVSNNHNLNLGLDAALNQKTTIGVNIGYADYNTNSDIWNRGIYAPRPDSALTFDGSIDANTHWKNWSGGVYLETQGAHPGDKFNISLDYLRHTNRNGSDIISSLTNISSGHPVTTDSLYSPHQRSLGDIHIDVAIFKMDFSRNLGKDIRLETGLKASLADSRSYSAVEGLVDGSWTVSLGTSSNMRMRENIGAAYSSLSWQLSPKILLTAGLRYEYATTRITDFQTGKIPVDRHLGVLFPNLALTQKLSDRSELQFSYSKRISRPSYNDLASFVGYSDPVAIYTGNPFLRPTISHSVKLGYSYKSYSFSVLAGRDEHPIELYQLTESADRNVLIIGPQNLRYRNLLNLQLTLPFKPTPWWSMTYSFVGGWRHFKEDFTRYPLEKTFFGFNSNFSEVFILPKNYSLEISGWYNGGGYMGTSYIDGFGVLNAGIKKEFANNKGTLQLTASDLLRTLSIRGDHGRATEEAFSSVNHYTYNTESTVFPVLKLTYTRSFGSSSTGRSPKNGASDERDRIRAN